MTSYIKMKEYMEKYHLKNNKICTINPPDYASDSTKLKIEECRSRTEIKKILYYDEQIQLRTNSNP